jgi:hypothetical protein
MNRCDDTRHTLAPEHAAAGGAAAGGAAPAVGGAPTRPVPTIAWDPHCRTAPGARGLPAVGHPGPWRADARCTPTHDSGTR